MSIQHYVSISCRLRQDDFEHYIKPAIAANITYRQLLIEGAKALNVIMPPNENPIKKK